MRTRGSFFARQWPVQVGTPTFEEGAGAFALVFGTAEAGEGDAIFDGEFEGFVGHFILHWMRWCEVLIVGVRVDDADDTIVSMIKGITLVTPVASAAAFDPLARLFAALGFEPGKGWDDGTGRGAAFLAPVGNLEIMTGRPPAVPPILIEVTQIDAVRAVVEHWMSAGPRTEEIASLVTEVEPTHWNSRLFRVTLDAGFAVGFWESENPVHGKPVAIEGDLSAAGMRFGVVVARWNAVITDRLLQGTLDALARSGAAKSDVQIVRVPGAWEIPSAARALAEAKTCDAVITLGCLLRGETAHYEAIYTEVARGIGQSQQETGVPHAFGVLTCETLEQALDRAGLKGGNKGFEAAIAAIEMVSIHRKITATEAAPQMVTR
jgi:6,7-dimethyl-8-ribityllumazine synthase